VEKDPQSPNAGKKQNDEQPDSCVGCDRAATLTNVGELSSYSRITLERPVEPMAGKVSVFEQ
jgi:hypothetical protein